MKATSSIDLILPCYNPGPGWTANIVKQWGRYREVFSDKVLQLIIVNDGSKNISADEIEKFKQECPKMRFINLEKNQGKGAALRAGAEQSNSDFVIFTDIDFPFTFESLVALTNSLLSGSYDIVVGHRSENYYQQTPGERKFISKLLRWVNKNIFKLKVADTQCGLKGFNTKGRKVFLQTEIERYLFDLEFLMLASKTKPPLKVFPCEVKLREEVVFSKLNMNIYFSEGKNILKLYLRKLFS